MRKRRLKATWSSIPFPTPTARGLPRCVGCDDGVDELLLDQSEILGIGTRRLLVGQLLHLLRGVVELAGQDHADRAGRVRVRGADQDVRFGNAALLLDAARGRCRPSRGG